MGRYSRLLQLSDFSKEDLKILQSKTVLVIGAGGVGQHVATYLVTNGIENLRIVDYDAVETSNLNRQILLTEKHIGNRKVDVVREALFAKNHNALVKSINCKVDESNISEIITNEYDVVVDALDNWEGKLLVSRECKKLNIPLLHVGVDGMRGQYAIFEKCSLQDLVGKDIIGAPKDGVMGPMVGAVASLATVHLIKYLIGKEEADELHYLDFDNHQFNKIKIPRK